MTDTSKTNSDQSSEPRRGVATRGVSEGSGVEALSPAAARFLSAGWGAELSQSAPAATPASPAPSPVPVRAIGAGAIPFVPEDEADVPWYRSAHPATAIGTGPADSGPTAPASEPTPEPAVTRREALPPLSRPPRATDLLRTASVHGTTTSSEPPATPSLPAARTGEQAPAALPFAPSSFRASPPPSTAAPIPGVSRSRAAHPASQSSMRERASSDPHDRAMPVARAVVVPRPEPQMVATTADRTPARWFAPLPPVPTDFPAADETRDGTSLAVRDSVGSRLVTWTRGNAAERSTLPALPDSADLALRHQPDAATPWTRTAAVASIAILVPVLAMFLVARGGSNETNASTLPANDYVAGQTTESRASVSRTATTSRSFTTRAVTTSTSPLVVPTDGVPYSDPGGLFRMQLAPSWEEAKTDSNLFKAQWIKAGTSGSDRRSVGVGAAPSFGMTSARAATDAFKFVLVKAIPEGQLGTIEYVTVANGQEAMRVEVASPGGRRSRFFGIVTGSMLAYVVTTAPESGAQAFFQEADPYSRTLEVISTAG